MSEEIELSDAEIIRSVLAGARDEFRHLVRRYQDRIYSLIMRQVGDEAVGRELTQDVMIRAYLALPKYRGDSHVLTWLTRIAINCTNSYFASSRYRRSQQQELLDPDHDAGLPDGEEALHQKTMVQRLRRSLGTLDPKYREVLVLCGFENRSYEEAAMILGLPLGTVCSRITTARNLLRKKMQRVSL